LNPCGYRGLIGADPGARRSILDLFSPLRLGHAVADFKALKEFQEQHLADPEMVRPALARYREGKPGLM